MAISVTKILNTLHRAGYEDTLYICRDRMTKGKKTALFTPNSEMIYRASSSPELWKILRSADILFPDGIGSHIGMRLLGIPARERTTGIKLGEKILDMSAHCGYKVFLLGAKEGRASRAAKLLQAKHKGILICGHHHGYFDKCGKENDRIVKMINRSGADILLVCFGFPDQEKWISENMPFLSNVKLAIGLGGSLDVWSGVVRRAPEFVSNSGLEWLWRICCDPKRVKRVGFLVGFTLLVLKEAFLKTQDFGKCYEIDNFLK